MSLMATRESPKCPACKTFVYPAEHVMAADRKPYHRWCVKCFNCRVALNPRTLNEHNEQLFCNSCYQNIFNPQEFSMYGYNGNITEEDRLRADRERLEKEERERREREARLNKMLDSGDGDGDGGFTFSQVKVQELMTIAPIQQMQTMGL